MLVIFDNCRDPYFNLATEEFLLKESRFDQPVIRIWQNSPAIIVGRFQNTLAEIDRDFVAQQGIAVVRRITGGGAVYHDLGNVNYTVVQKAAAKKIDFEFFNRPIIELLAGYGIKAELSGRNDIEAGGRKISGSAQTIVGGRVLHHGTLLFSSDLAVLGKALKPKDSKFISKGVQSVRARVGNIADYMEKPISVEQFMKELSGFFLRQTASRSYDFTFDDFQKIKRLANEKYGQWLWNFGQSPKFNLIRTHKYDWGELSFLLLVEDGIIKDIQVYGDFFSPYEVGELFKQLAGVRFVADELKEQIKKLELWQVLPGITPEELYKQLLP